MNSRRSLNASAKSLALCLGRRGALKVLEQGSGPRLDTVCARYAGVEDLGSLRDFW